MTKKYKLTNEDVVIISDTGGSFDPNSKNIDAINYNLWLSEGNVPDPADTIPVVEPTPTNEERLAALEATQKTVTDKLIAAKLMTDDDVMIVNK